MKMTSTLSMMVAHGISQFESYAMRRGSQQPAIHMTQQMTTKVALSYGGRTCSLTAMCNTWYQRADRREEAKQKAQGNEKEKAEEEDSVDQGKEMAEAKEEGKAVLTW